MIPVSGYEQQQTTIIRDRFLGFLIWQSINSTLVFFLCKTLLLSPFSPSTSFLASILSFIFFQLSLLLFSTSLFFISSPLPVAGVSLSELAFGLLKLVFVSGGQPLPPDFRRRARVSLSFLLFLASSGLSGFLSVVCLSVSPVFGAFGLRGLIVGLLYGLHYLCMRRWILEFPIVQRSPFFSYKMGIIMATVQAIKLSSAGYIFSALLPIFLVKDNGQVVMGKVIVEQILFYITTFVVFLCWELNRHLLQVFLTKRYSFAPPKGSAAAEMNPSEPLFAALEETTSRSLLKYLAYLDLCMVSESNVDTWRRAAFFEETGETYKKVISVCLKPLEQFTLDLSDVLASSNVKSFPENLSFSRLQEPFYDFQLCAWCARIATSLTVRSHKEDRFGVAQLTGSNTAVISTLLPCLLSIETFMGKKTNLQSNLTSPASIKWAAFTPVTRETEGVTNKKKNSRHYSKAYAMADVVRTSIYHIVSNFHQEMLQSSKAGLLEKDWIAPGTPLFGSRELLVQKLRLFLEFQA